MEFSSLEVVITVQEEDPNTGELSFLKELLTKPDDLKTASQLLNNFMDDCRKECVKKLSADERLRSLVFKGKNWHQLSMRLLQLVYFRQQMGNYDNDGKGRQQPYEKYLGVDNFR